MATETCVLQEQSNKAESLVRLHDGMVTAAEALGRLAGEELRGAQAEHLEEEAAARVRKLCALAQLKLRSSLRCLPSLSNHQRARLLKLRLLLFMKSLFL